MPRKDELDLTKLSAEEKELIFDLVQLALDIGGIIEPTPFCDIASSVISLYEMDWVGAPPSTVGIFPYFGDLAKTGKIPNYALKLDRAIMIAKTNHVFANVLNPIMVRLLHLLDRIPTEHMRRKFPNQFSRLFMQRLYNIIESMRNKIVRALPPGARVLTRIDRLTDELLLKTFGSTENVGAIARRNVRVAAEFFDKYEVGFVDGGPDVGNWANKLRGIDLHAADAIYVSTAKVDYEVAQYVQLFAKPSKFTKSLENFKIKEKLPKDLNYYVMGDWLTEARGSVSHRNLGVSAGGRSIADGNGKMVATGRVRLRFKLSAEVEVLRTKAAGTGDYWTQGRKSDAVSVHHQQVNGSLKSGDTSTLKQYTSSESELVAGGGDQIFLPNAYKYLIPVAGQ